MKYLFLFILVWVSMISRVWSQGKGVNFETISFSQALEKGKTEKKYIFLDAYTSWCVPCKRMEKEVFSEQKAAEFFNPLFVNVKYDMEKGEGIQLKERYEVTAYPTYLIINQQGDLVHKLIGYSAIDTFISKVKKGMAEGYSSANLNKRFMAGERDPSFINKYKTVLTETYDHAGLLGLYRKLFTELTDEQRFDSSSWEVYKKSLRSHEDTIFQYMLYNQENVSRYVKKEELINKLKVVCFVALFNHYRGEKPLEPGKLEKLMEDIKFIPVDFNDDVNVVSRAISLQNAQKYDQLITLYEQSVSGLTINRLFWDKHLAGLKMVTPVQRQRIKDYLIKTKEKCNPNSVKFYTELVASYLKEHQ